MIIARRSLLAIPALAVSSALAVPARAETALDAAMADRAIGSPDAKVVVAEWYSLTCPHCARFAIEALPRIKAEQVDRYVPFVEALLASQARWAYARGINTTDELAKMAALAGMPRPAFDAAIADSDLRNAILKAQEDAEKTLSIDSTPTFVINGPKVTNRKETGEQSPEAFAKFVTDAQA